MPMKSFSTRDGCSISYDDSGTGPALLLIHGWSLDHRMWSALTPLLAKDFQVIVYDRRGCGRSTGEPDLRNELDDIDELLDELEISQTVLLGMSQGGRIALRYCLTRPRRVAAIILQGAPLDGYPPPSSDEGRIPLSHYTELIASGNVERFRELWLDHPMMRVPADDSGLQDQLNTMLQDYHGLDLQGDIVERMAFPLNVADHLAEIDCPALIIEGEQEIDYLKRVADKLCAQIPAAERVTLAGGGHLINMIAPESYSSAVIDFLHRRRCTRRPR